MKIYLKQIEVGREHLLRQLKGFLLRKRLTYSDNFEVINITSLVPTVRLEIMDMVVKHYFLKDRQMYNFPGVVMADQSMNMCFGARGEVS